MSKVNAKKQKLPEDFKSVLWGYNFKTIDPEKSKERIIINTINYGDWKQWQWIAKFYGKQTLKNIIENIPVSEFNPRALRLISLILKIKKMKYVLRSDKIRAKASF